MMSFGCSKYCMSIRLVVIFFFAGKKHRTTTFKKPRTHSQRSLKKAKNLMILARANNSPYLFPTYLLFGKDVNGQVIFGRASTNQARQPRR